MKNIFLFCLLISELSFAKERQPMPAPFIEDVKEISNREMKMQSIFFDKNGVDGLPQITVATAQYRRSDSDSERISHTGKNEIFVTRINHLLRGAYVLKLKSEKKINILKKIVH